MDAPFEITPGQLAQIDCFDATIRATADNRGLVNRRRLFIDKITRPHRAAGQGPRREARERMEQYLAVRAVERFEHGVEPFEHGDAKDEKHDNAANVYPPVAALAAAIERYERAGIAAAPPNPVMAALAAAAAPPVAPPPAAPAFRVAYANGMVKLDNITGGLPEFRIPDGALSDAVNLREWLQSHSPIAGLNVPVDPIVAAVLASPAGIGRRAERLARLREVADSSAGAAPADSCEWHRATHDITRGRFLSETDPRAPDPPGFKTQLYAPQATLLHAMLALERSPFLKLPPLAGARESEEDQKARWRLLCGRMPNVIATICNAYVGEYLAPVLLQTNIARISEKFAFGKTVLVLALVCASRAVKPTPLMVNTPVIPCHRRNVRTNVAVNKARVRAAQNVLDDGRMDKKDDAHVFNPNSGLFLPELSIKFSRVIPVTVVAAASSVIDQWVDNIKRYTNLVYFVVDNVFSLKKLQQSLNTKRDLILVKIGKVTANFVLPGEAKTESKHRSLLGALAALYDGAAFARMVVDDFDTADLAADDRFLPAVFTWIVSATRRAVAAAHRTVDGDTPAAFVRNNILMSVRGAALDDIVNVPLSMRCDPPYVDAFINTTTIKFRLVRVAGGGAASLLRGLGVADDIVELVNGDAVGAAATALGIDAKSPQDLVERVLADRKAKYAHAIAVIARVHKAYDLLGTATVGPAESGPSNDAVKKMRAALKDGKEPNVDVVVKDVLQNLRQPGMRRAARDALVSLELWARDERDKFGQTLERMRANIREQCCLVCTLPFDEKGDAFVLNCCQIVVCADCVAPVEAKRRRFVDRCPNCVRDLDVKKDIIRVGGGADLEKALSDSTLDPPPAPPPALPAAAADVKTDSRTAAMAAITNPKLRALVQILREEKVDCLSDAEAPPDVCRGMLAGKRDVPWPSEIPKKFLVFAGVSETAALIARTLASVGIAHVVLHGTPKQKGELIEKFRGSTTHVMVVAASSDCSGIHLPFVYAGVEYQRFGDTAVRTQLRGRYHRTGRDYSSVCIMIRNSVE